MNQHPNASVAGGAGAFTVVVVYVATQFGLDVPAEVASAFTTLVAAAVLYLGRRRPA